MSIEITSLQRPFIRSMTIEPNTDRNRKVTEVVFNIINYHLTTTSNQPGLFI